ncbi:MAG: hypothetical protein AMJ78_01135 [Omnitrophica WOR_2 bacterium SM23_29]|nr:MAG: hypothetical protein AMJ78_01135 [Omnitrophica WOR_2 bacterium SM23_29]
MTIVAKILSRIGDELVEWFEFFFIKNIPGKIGRILRRGYWSTRFSRYARFSIYTGCEITSPRKISIANGVTIANYMPIMEAR